MKKISIIGLMSINLIAGTVSLSVGIGQEIIVKPREIDVKLVEERITYQFDNGFLVGYTRMDGSANVGLSQGRNDFIVGYGFRYDRFAPYLTVSQGELLTNGRHYNSNSYIIGTGVKLTESVFSTLQYRYRRDREIEWITDRFQVGVGYNFNKNFSTQLSYGISNGTLTNRDYESNQYSLIGTYKF